MRVIVVANTDQEREMRAKKMEANTTLIFKNELPAPDEFWEAEAFFILNQNFHSYNFKPFGSKPVIVNSVIGTLSEWLLPQNVSRINGWPGFLQRDTWEIASGNKDLAEEVFTILGWKIIFVKDEPGLVAARVISMIINEAFFALDEKISTKKEIDLAMKLGTNYPYGPFEWAEKVGLQNVYDLLKKLSEKDSRYLPSPALEKSISK